MHLDLKRLRREAVLNFDGPVLFLEVGARVRAPAYNPLMEKLSVLFFILIAWSFICERACSSEALIFIAW